jgi:hypothetical protein
MIMDVFVIPQNNSVTRDRPVPILVAGGCA